MGMNFQVIAKDFRAYHSNSLNVALHIFTTPVMFVAFYWLLIEFVHTMAPLFVTGIYMSLLTINVPRRIWFLTLFTCFCICTAAYFMWQPWHIASAVFLINYFGQDLAHFATGEPTFQSTYMGNFNWPILLFEHTFYLVPLLWDAALSLKFPIIALPLEISTVVHAKSDTPKQIEDMKTIREWAVEQGEATKHTIHHWFETLPGPVYYAYDRLANSKAIWDAFEERFPSSCYTVVILPGMNEIYQTAPDHYSSDRVFYRQHVDGPWCFFPSCIVFRCLLSMTDNKNIETIFPMDRTKKVLQAGDSVAFDFNREIHYITAKDPNLFESRIALKLHYAVYPKMLAPLGWFLGFLTTMYDQIARWWFLQTLNPDQVATKFGTSVTLWVTWAVMCFHFIIGSENLCYVIFMAFFNQFKTNLFLYSTSYVHYLHYIGTYYHRENINFGCFKRDVVFFKSLACFQIVWIYVTNFEFNLLSIVLIVLGVGLATAASVALGVDRTYFSSELGFCEPKWITKFPYNTGIPHPMIVGALMWLGGVHVLPGVRASYPLLIPFHCLFYLAHMFQEHFDIHHAQKKTV